MVNSQALMKKMHNCFIVQFIGGIQWSSFFSRFENHFCVDRMLCKTVYWTMGVFVSKLVLRIRKYAFSGSIAIFQKDYRNNLALPVLLYVLQQKWNVTLYYTAQKMKFFVKGFFSKYDETAASCFPVSDLVTFT